MSRVTKTFVDNETVIMAADMNGIVADINDLEDAMATATGTIANKVDKETGKGLSTNDYTTAEKNKLAGLESTYATKAELSTSVAAATTAIESELDAVSSDVEALDDAVTAITDVVVMDAPEWDNGHYLTTNVDVGAKVRETPLSNAEFRCAEIPCAPGDVFVLRVTGASAARAWCFVDAERRSLGSGGNTAFRGRLTAPAGAVKLIVNDKSGDGTCTQVVGTGLVGAIARGDLLGLHGSDLLSFGTLESGYLNEQENLTEAAYPTVTSDYIRVLVVRGADNGGGAELAAPLVVRGRAIPGGIARPRTTSGAASSAPPPLSAPRTTRTRISTTWTTATSSRRAWAMCA